MIKNLLFDLGGVIMDIRKERCVEAFKALGLPDTDSFFGEYSQQGPFLLLEGGKITVDEFHGAVRRLIPHEVSDAEIDAAFCRFLIGIPEHRLAALRKLASRFRICLLSNTNPIMWHSVIADEFRKEGLTIDDYFDGIVTSFEACALKPEAAIFRYAADTLGIVPGETLFLDDSQRNLDAAAALGFRTALVVPPDEFLPIVEAICG